MTYTSYLYFFGFVGVVYLLYLIVPVKHRWLVLLAGSYAFYMFMNGFLTAFLLATTVSIYFCGIHLGKIQDKFNIAKKDLSKDEKKVLKESVTKKKKGVVAIAVVINLGILLFLKYFNFFAEQGNLFLSMFNLHDVIPLISIALPLGISYYTLQAIGYVVDVYRGRCKPETNAAKLALFLSFFPQMTEGPIGRYDQLAPQLVTGHKYSNENFTAGVTLILWGFFKKLVISDRASFVANTVFNDYSSYGGLTVAVAIMAYTLQLYTDFSGCIDIMTGCAKIFGIDLAVNFRQPFFSKSVNEFWRRWHITLGSWFKDYVFYPVSLSAPFMKLSKKAQNKLNRFFGSLIPSAAALLVVWFGTGLWHGASWKYVVYGLYYYFIMLLGMLFEPLFLKFFDKTHINRNGKYFSAFRVFRTFILVNIGMMLFRVNDLNDFGRMFCQLFNSFSLSDITSGSIFTLGTDGPDFVILILGVVAMLIVASIKEKGCDLKVAVANSRILIKWPVMIGLIMVIVIFGAYGDNYAQVASIYAQF